MTKALWWLSFCDATRPKGSHFLGACIVPGVDMIDAVKAAHRLKCNPGGEVKGTPVPRDVKIDAQWLAPRLLSR